MGILHRLSNVYYQTKWKLPGPYRNANLLIIDDVFPNPYSDWRYNEYLHYLETFQNTQIYTGIVQNARIIWRDKYDDYLTAFHEKHPLLRNNVRKMNFNDRFNAKLGYCLFFNNMRYIYPIFKKNNIPFVFTLYPGGGFQKYDKEIEKQLQTFFSSGLFRHVIVTMPHVLEYIKEKFNIPESKITYIYGVPLKFSDSIKKVSGKGKTISIVFSAHKYSPNGIDKGFDIFNNVAKKFEHDPRFRFTVLGNYTPEDLITKTGNIAFKARIKPEQLNDEFAQHDIILSPNRSHVLGLGAFDGFPTGSVMHAAHCGCLMMMSDDMSNAPSLDMINERDFVLIAPNTEMIVEKLNYLAENKDRIREIAENGKKTLEAHLAMHTQLSKRSDILNRYL